MEDISCEICGFMCPNAQDVVDKDHPYIPFSAVLQRQQNIMEMSYPMWQLEYSHRLYPGASHRFAGGTGGAHKVYPTWLAEELVRLFPEARNAAKEIDMSWPSSENGTPPKTNLSLLDDYRPGQIATEFSRGYYRRDLPAMSPSQLSARQHAILLANEYFMVYKKAINALRMMKENPKGTVIIQPSYSLLALGERELNKRRLADLFRSLPFHYECLVATSDGPNLQQQEQTCLPNFLGLNNTISTANIPQNPNIVHNRPVCSIISNTNWNLIQNTGMCYNPSCIFTGSHSGSIWESYNITAAGGLNSAVTEGHIHYIITTKQTPPMENIITDEDIISYNLPAKSTKMINDTAREEQNISEEGNNFDCGNEDNSNIQKIGDNDCKTETDKKEKKIIKKLDKEYRGKKMNDLKGSWKLNGLEDENESTETESSTSGSSKIITSCAFCKKNGESASVFLSHNLMDSTTKIVTCPILRTYVCQTCNATGDYAHTRSYCPKERERAGKVQSTTLALKSTPRMSNGQLRPFNK